MDGNPILTGQLPDTRYSLAAQGYINGSDAGKFLGRMIDQLEEAEPTISFVPKNFLHLTLGEVAYNPNGRKSSVITAGTAKQYYQALNNRLPRSDKPLRLKLHSIFPTLDLPIEGTNKRSASIVSVFTTEGDEMIYQIRDGIRTSVQEEGLEFSARLGVIRVIFITLGRLTQPPFIREDYIPLLDSLQRVNEQIPNNCFAQIDNIDLISTTPVSYPYPWGHVFMDPKISLTERIPIDSNKIKLLSYKQRAAKVK